MNSLSGRPVDILDLLQAQHLKGANGAPALKGTHQASFSMACSSSVMPSCPTVVGMPMERRKCSKARMRPAQSPRRSREYPPPSPPGRSGRTAPGPALHDIPGPGPPDGGQTGPVGDVEHAGSARAPAGGWPSPRCGRSRPGRSGEAVMGQAPRPHDAGTGIIVPWGPGPPAGELQHGAHQPLRHRVGGLHRLRAEK